jgi:Protein of unknown function (DUF3455)
VSVGLFFGDSLSDQRPPYDPADWDILHPSPELSEVFNMHTTLPVVAALSLASVLAACATPTPLMAPKVASGLQAPGSTAPYNEVLASGVQIYECSRKADGTVDWVFKAPEASLTNRAGATVGKHYAGPTWEASDGSKVVGEVKARDPGPVATAIPWLLLAAKSNAGTGLYADTKFIQRVATAGGLAPAAGCTESSLKSEAKVPYTATYFFYR